VLPPVPGWARSEAPVTDADADSGAAFQAGAALAMLDCRVRAGVPFAGAWRRRLALKAAAASARIARRGEDEAMLRDAFLLRHGGDDPGPAGRMLVAWRGLDRSAPVAGRAETHKAMNALIQGSAARHTKLWMRACWREGIVPLLQMHDALDCSVASPELAERVAQLGREAVTLEVPLQVDLKFGRSWGDAKHTWEDAAAGDRAH
jgi:Protein of unknown function (DUF1403)/DNA polymerase family A